MAPVHSRQLFSYENLVHAMAGAAGSVAAMTAFYPLDTVRSVLQVDEKRESKNTFAMMAELIKEEGFVSLYRGLLPVLTSVCASNFIYFYTFHGLKALRGTSDRSQSALQDLLLASLAGAVNVVVTTPLWVVNTRLKLQGTKFHTEEIKGSSLKYKGMIDGLIKVGQIEGMRGLWSSTLPSLMLVINPGIQFMVYETLKRNVKKSVSAQELSGMLYFSIGAIAKAISTFLTYPLQIIQSKFRYGHHRTPDTRNLGVLQMITYLLRSQGVQGLYKGLEAKLLQTVLTAALMFLFYEKITATVFRVMKAASMPVKT